jgi:hypothetical protein
LAQDDGTRPPSRSGQKAQAARDSLVPLEPGERPWPLVASSLVAFALGALTFVLWATHAEVNGAQPSLSVVIVYSGLMFALSAGTWRIRYWAVLGFQALLAIGILGFALAAIRVTSVLWLLICLAVISFSGVLFWKLVRIVGRIQAADHREP